MIVVGYISLCCFNSILVHRLSKSLLCAYYSSGIDLFHSGGVRFMFVPLAERPTRIASVGKKRDTLYENEAQISACKLIVL